MALKTYLSSQGQQGEEEDKEGDGSHQLGFLQDPWPVGKKKGFKDRPGG